MEVGHLWLNGWGIYHDGQGIFGKGWALSLNEWGIYHNGLGIIT